MSTNILDALKNWANPPQTVNVSDGQNSQVPNNLGENKAPEEIKEFDIEDLLNNPKAPPEVDNEIKIDPLNFVDAEKFNEVLKTMTLGDQLPQAIMESVTANDPAKLKAAIDVMHQSSIAQAINMISNAMRGKNDELEAKVLSMLNADKEKTAITATPYLQTPKVQQMLASILPQLKIANPDLIKNPQLLESHMRKLFNEPVKPQAKEVEIQIDPDEIIKNTAKHYGIDKMFN